MVYLIAEKLAMPRPISIGAAILFASIPRLIWGAVGGMEVPLYVFFVCLGFYWHIRYTWHDRWRAYLPTLAFGLATLARPECAVLVVLGLLDRGISAWRTRSEKFGLIQYAKALPLHLSLFALLLLPWAIFNWICSGHLLPPAFYAKVVHIGGSNFESMLIPRLVNVYQYLSQAVAISMMDSWVMLVALLPGIIVCILRSRKDNGILLLPLTFVGVPVAVGQLAANQTVGAQLVGQNGRYSGYLVPALILMGMIGWASVLGWLMRRRAASSTVLALYVAIAAALVFSANTNNLLSMIYGYEVQNINTMQVQLGKWAASLPKGTVIAANDVGAIAYFSRKTVIDTVGVVNPEVVPYLHRHEDSQTGLWEYLSKRKPEYLIIFPNWYPVIAANPELEYVKSIELDYNIVCGGPQMIVYATPWTRRHAQN